MIDSRTFVRLWCRPTLPSNSGSPSPRSECTQRSGRQDKIKYTAVWVRECNSHVRTVVKNKRQAWIAVRFKTTQRRNFNYRHNDALRLQFSCLIRPPNHGVLFVQLSCRWTSSANETTQACARATGIEKLSHGIATDNQLVVLTVKSPPVQYSLLHFCFPCTCRKSV